MAALPSLAACAGSWRGTNTLQDPHTNRPAESASTATVTPTLGGKFLRIDYTWGYQRAPQEGSILLGFETKSGQVSACWIDTWHMSDKMMLCEGSAASDGKISVRGSYAAPPGPDWGWRIEIAADPGKALRLVMFNIWPDGKEELAVEAAYVRT